MSDIKNCEYLVDSEQELYKVLDSIRYLVSKVE